MFVDATKDDDDFINYMKDKIRTRRDCPTRWDQDDHCISMLVNSWSKRKRRLAEIKRKNSSKTPFIKQNQHIRFGCSDDDNHDEPPEKKPQGLNNKPILHAVSCGTMDETKDYDFVGYVKEKIRTKRYRPGAGDQDDHYINMLMDGWIKHTMKVDEIKRTNSYEKPLIMISPPKQNQHIRRNSFKKLLIKQNQHIHFGCLDDDPSENKPQGFFLSMGKKKAKKGGRARKKPSSGLPFSFGRWSFRS